MSVWSKNKQLLVFFPSVNQDLSQLQKLSALILWLSVSLRLSQCNSRFTGVSLSGGIFDIELNYNIFLWKKYF